MNGWIMYNEITKAASVVSMEIDDKFSKSSRNKTIARSCLTLCKEWSMIKESALDGFTKSQAKKSCKKYVKENLKEEVAGNFLVRILFSFIVKLIIEWVIHNYIKRLLK